MPAPPQAGIFAPPIPPCFVGCEPPVVGPALLAAGSLWISGRSVRSMLTFRYEREVATVRKDDSPPTGTFASLAAASTALHRDPRNDSAAAEPEGVTPPLDSACALAPWPALPPPPPPVGVAVDMVCAWIKTLWWRSNSRVLICSKKKVRTGNKSSGQEELRARKAAVCSLLVIKVKEDADEEGGGTGLGRVDVCEGLADAAESDAPPLCIRGGPIV